MTRLLVQVSYVIKHNREYSMFCVIKGHTDHKTNINNKIDKTLYVQTERTDLYSRCRCIHNL